MVTFTRTRTGLGHNETAGLVRRAVECCMECQGVTVPYLVDVTLTDGETIREINRENRDVDRETDVLSFPLNELTPGEFDPDACELDPGTGQVLLGDMVINIPLCQTQGEEYGHGYRREVSYLAVHSALHLLGYDHLDEGPMKRAMRQREDYIMDKLRIPR